MSDTIRWCFTHQIEDHFMHQEDRRKLLWKCDVATMIRADQPVYRIVFPNPGDGTQFSADDLAEMETLNYGLEDAIKAGVLVRIGAET